MQLGFIGLGHLGKTIATRLQECGHELTVWNRSPDKAAGRPWQVAESPAAVAAAADLVLLCLFDSDAVKEVLSGPTGLLSTTASGTCIVDLTTNHFGAVEEFYRLCEQAGAAYLEAPVLGSVVPAAKGALTVLVSGRREDYNRAEPVLADLGKHLFFLGEPALAAKMKVINNLALGSFMATLAEALALGEDVGLSRTQVLDILDAGGGQSLVLTAKRTKLLEEDFATHFSNALIYKDLDCLQDLAYARRKPLFTGAVVKELYARTFEAGIDQEDFSAIYKLFRKG